MIYSQPGKVQQTYLVLYQCQRLILVEKKYRMCFFNWILFVLLFPLISSQLLQGPPGGNSSNCSTLLKRKKGEKGKRSNQHSPVGALLVLPFLSKFPLPTDGNASQSKVLYK